MSGSQPLPFITPTIIGVMKGSDKAFVGLVVCPHSWEQLSEVEEKVVVTRSNISLFLYTSFTCILSSESRKEVPKDPDSSGVLNFSGRSL